MNTHELAKQMAEPVLELKARIAALEKALSEEGWVESAREAALERIAALETEFKDFSAWVLELPGPIGPTPRFEQRIAALESIGEKRVATLMTEIAKQDQRIAALEDDNEQVSSQLIDLNHRIAALEEIAVGLGARHELLAVKHHERIAVLEELAALEERIHEVKEERSH